MKILKALAMLVLATGSCVAQLGFLFQPISQSASVGADVLFLGTAYGSEPPAYQWRKNGLPLTGQNLDFLYLTNLQLEDAGDYDVVATTSFGSITSQVGTLTVDATFTKLYTGPLVNEGGNSTGSAWGDFDNDGDLDVLVIHGGTDFNSLFRNNGNGTFVKLSASPVTTDLASAGGAAWADYDNDGWLDLLVVNGNWRDLLAFQAPPESVFLYHNNGDGTFSKVTAGIGSDSGTVITAAWSDYDRDGWLDLITGPVGEPFFPGGFLYHNNAGILSRVTNALEGTLDFRLAQSASWADYDNDGDADLFFADVAVFGPGNETLFQNTGEGAFVQINDDGHLTSSGQNSTTASWADYDADGDLDVFVGNIEGEVKFLFRNDGDGAFTQLFGEIAEEEGAVESAAWGDYDNDGWIDLFVANNMGGGNFLFHNSGDGTFSKVAVGSPTGDRANSVSGVWVDIDNDGFVDLFVANLSENNFLYRNNGNSNAWLTVRCAPYVSNRSAIGAKVRVLATIAGTERWQLREMASRDSSGSPNSLRAEFGLGDATNVTTVRVEWPSGLVTELQNVAPKQFLTITEPPSILIAGSSVVEGDAGTRILNFTVQLREASTNAVSVDFFTRNGTAVAGSDYAPTNGTIHFAPGQTNITLPVIVFGNVIDQQDRSFSMVLTNSTVLPIGLASAIGTIVDDDPLTVTIGAISVVEGDAGTTEALFPVSLSKIVDYAVSVGFQTLTSGTAQPGNDFVATNGAVSFDAGETNKLISIIVLGDTIDELNEVVSVRLLNPTNVVLDVIRSVFGTIVDDDPTPTVHIGNASVVEGDAGTNHAVFTVTLSGRSSRTVTVPYSTQDNGATSGSDYVSQTGVLSFSALATNRSIVIVINGDTLLEPLETFYVNLGNPTNAVLGVSQGVGTILDNDLRIVGMAIQGSEFRLQFSTIEGRRYRVEWTASLSGTPDWDAVPGLENIMGNGAIMEVADPAAGGNAQRFYRLLQLPL